MDYTHTKKGLRLALYIATALFIACGITILTAQSAHADIACGEISCSVGTSQTASGSNGGGNPGGGGSSGGGSNGGSGGYDPYQYEFHPCWQWQSGAGSADTYPLAEDGGSLACETGWSKSATDTWSDQITCPAVIRNGKTIAAKGRYVAYPKGVNLNKPEALDGNSWTATPLEWRQRYEVRYNCAYPLDQYIIPTKYTFDRVVGGEGKFYQNGSTYGASVWSASGDVLADSTGWRSTGFDFNNAFESNPSLDQTFNAQTIIDTLNGKPVPRYSYYKVNWNLLYARFTRTEWPSWMKRPATNEQLSTVTKTSTQPYTYACNFNPAMKAGIDQTGIFEASKCAGNPPPGAPPTNWECKIGTLTVAGTTNELGVMRDGSRLPVAFPTVGTTGPGVRDSRDWKTYTDLDMNKVTPRNTPDPNASNQYFDSTWTWRTWEKYDPSKSQTLAFYWASDPGTSFQFTQKYKFTAEFLVPVQGGLNEATHWEWVTDTAECAQERTSPKIEVLRSVNTVEGDSNK